MNSRFTIEQWRKRFYENVNTGGDCWLWDGKRNVQGYGVMYANLEGKKYWTAHRVSQSRSARLVRPLARDSAWFSSCVPSLKCSGLTHHGLSQLCSTCISSGTFPQ